MNKDASILTVNGAGQPCWLDSKNRYHRLDGPALEHLGHAHWYKHGLLHRDNGPAAEYSYGLKQWYQNGVCHRDNGPAIESKDETMWFKHGKLHRENGPARISRYGKQWYIEDKLHREDGPAFENANGLDEWYYKGIRIRCSTVREYLFAVSKLLLKRINKNKKQLELDEKEYNKYSKLIDISND